MEPREILKSNFEKVLKRRGATQASLAKKAGTSASAVSQKVNGNIELKTLFEIAEMLDVNPAELVDTGRKETSVEELRLACITAILEIHPNNLTITRNILRNVAKHGAKPAVDFLKNGET